MAQQERKEMGLANTQELSQTKFDTLVNMKNRFSKDKQKWYTIVTLGREQDKTFLIGARKDGKGTYLVTDWEEYQALPNVERESVSV